MPTLCTIARPARLEMPRIKGSRFVGHAAPVEDEAEARAVIASVAAELAGAGHHCFAWRLGLGDDRSRSSDDGEPAGSAGPPILRHLDGSGLRDVVVVVSRWFGGTKLGVGGLIRAYGGTAGAVLAAAERLERQVVSRVQVSFPFSFEGRVRAAVAAHGATAGDPEWSGEGVSLLLVMPVEAVEACVARLSDVCNGRAKIVVLD